MAIALVGSATLIGAWIFQYGVGLSPCPLCLEQRIAYYVAIPLSVMILLGLSVGATHKVLMLALLAIAAAMLWNAGLGVYHSGIEWHWWPGPQDCSGTGADFSKSGGLLQQMQNTRVVRCDEAAWRFLGLSLAGYNVLISLALAAVTVASLVNGIPMVIVQGVADGAVALVARATGEGERGKAAAAARQAVWLALLLGVLLGVPPGLAARPLAASRTLVMSSSSSSSIRRPERANGSSSTTRASSVAVRLIARPPFRAARRRATGPAPRIHGRGASA